LDPCTMRLRIPVLGLILVAVLTTLAQAQQPDPHRAGLVVVHGDGITISTCVTFSGESISGAELLRRSGLGVKLGEYGGLGYGVCAIGDEGCPAGRDCFCECRGSPCAYWVYSHLGRDDSWAISGVGASGWQVRDGDVDGWVWGDGSAAPPAVAFEEICPSQGAGPAEHTAAALPSPNAASATPATHATEGSKNAKPAIQPVADERDFSVWGYSALGVAIVGLVSWLVLSKFRASRV
jgi:hypothetical protein